MNRPKQYRDKGKWRKAKNRQRKRYYDKTTLLYINNPKRRWTEEEIEMLFNNNITDMELSDILKRSVKGIQIKRSRVKAEREKELELNII